MLRMTEPAHEAVRKHGEETYPHECCGVLLGISHPQNEDGSSGANDVKETVRAENTRTDSAQNRYQISPHELVSIQREARDRDLEIVGFYHSHPDHPARWSPTDFAEAHWLGCSYVITGVEKGAAKETNSFRLCGAGEDEKKFEDELIEIWAAVTDEPPAASPAPQPFWDKVRGLVPSGLIPAGLAHRPAGDKKARQR